MIIINAFLKRVPIVNKWYTITHLIDEGQGTFLLQIRSVVYEVVSVWKTVDKTVTPHVGRPQLADRSPESATRCLWLLKVRMSRRHRAAMSVNQSVTEDTSTCFLVCGQIIYLTCEMRRIRELVNKNLFLKIVVLDPILIYTRYNWNTDSSRRCSFFCPKSIYQHI